MLITKGVAAGDIATLKFMSGEEVVSKIDAITDTEYKLQNPMVLSMTQQGIGMIPFVITAEPNAIIPVCKDRVLLVTHTRKDAASSYLQQTTGISLG